MTDQQLNRSIVLIGAPAAGKSATGAALAKHTGLAFIDVDQQIEAQAGKPIRQIFAEHGEAYFRQLETDCTLSALATPKVVALGGGAVQTPRVREAIKNATVVLLTVQLAEALRRLGDGATRPLLHGSVADNWSALVAKRARIYQECADLIVPTDGLTPSQVADQIALQIGI